MQTDELVVRVQPAGGAWETIAADRLIGIYPENFVASANEWGSDTASFDLRRDPGSVHLDLQAFTPVEAEVAGVKVWKGRTLETPARDGADPSISVQCQGLQYHLDDDVYVAAYVHTSTSAWRDSRSFATTNLTAFPSAPQVDTGNAGAILLAWPGGNVTATDWGVTLDLGPMAAAKRVVLTVDNSTADGNGWLRIAGGNVPAADGFAENSDTALAAAVTGRVCAFTFTTARRYVHISYHRNNAFNFGADLWARLTSVQVFGATAYEAGNISILKASDVLKDALAQGAPLITDTTQVQATTFSIPDLHFEAAPESPRQAIQAVNALHNYITKIDVDDRIIFAPRPTAPLYEIGAWGGADFQDASSGSGADVYNRVLVTGTGPDGAPILVERTAGGQAGAALVGLTTPAPDNPSFATNTTSWTAVPGPVTRDTVNFDTGPASGSIPVGTFTETFTGAFKKGGTYVLQLAIKGAVGITLNFGSATDYSTVSFIATAGFAVYTITWTPLADSAAVTLRGSIGGTINIDSLILYQAVPTIVDRRGFRRTKIVPVNAALTTAVASQLGDVYLAAHKTQPLKGNVDAEPTGVRRITGGDVHPAHLLRETGQRLRLSHRTDPDTGGQGRDGMIATVTYTHDTRSAAIALDGDRRNFDVLLARFAAASPAS